MSKYPNLCIQTQQLCHPAVTRSTHMTHLPHTLEEIQENNHIVVSYSLKPHCSCSLNHKISHLHGTVHAAMQAEHKHHKSAGEWMGYKQLDVVQGEKKRHSSPQICCQPGVVLMIHQLDICGV